MRGPKEGQGKGDDMTNVPCIYDTERERLESGKMDGQAAPPCCLRRMVHEWNSEANDPDSQTQSYRDLRLMD